MLGSIARRRLSTGAAFAVRASRRACIAGVGPRRDDERERGGRQQSRGVELDRESHKNSRLTQGAVAKNRRGSRMSLGPLRGGTAVSLLSTKTLVFLGQNRGCDLAVHGASKEPT